MTPSDKSSGAPASAPSEGLITLTHVMYALHAVSAASGVFSPVLVVTAFLTGWPSIIAVIMNYVERSDVRGTWLESHFSWQLRTFWFALVWLLVGGVAFVTLVGVPIAVLLWIGTGLWVLYRLIRGWMSLTEAKPMRVGGQP